MPLLEIVWSPRLAILKQSYDVATQYPNASHMYSTPPYCQLGVRSVGDKRTFQICGRVEKLRMSLDGPMARLLFRDYACGRVEGELNYATRRDGYLDWLGDPADLPLRWLGLAVNVQKDLASSQVHHLGQLKQYSEVAVCAMLSGPPWAPTMDAHGRVMVQRFLSLRQRLHDLGFTAPFDQGPKASPAPESELLAAIRPHVQQTSGLAGS